MWFDLVFFLLFIFFYFTVKLFLPEQNLSSGGWGGQSAKAKSPPAANRSPCVCEWGLDGGKRKKVSPEERRSRVFVVPLPRAARASWSPLIGRLFELEGK